MNARLLALAACALLILPVAGCGNSDDETAVRELSKSLRADDNDLPVSKKQADCIANDMVDNVGTEDLQKYGILDKELKAKDDVGEVKMSKDDAEGAADAMMNCVDAQKLVVDAVGTSLGEEAEKCLEDSLEDEAIREFFVGLFSGDQDEASQKLVEPMMKCAAGSQ